MNHIDLLPIKRTEPELMREMVVHYSHPKGFVGRNICYAVVCNGTRYGSIVGGSATLHLPGRNKFFDDAPLSSIVNNIFFHIEPPDDGAYPIRNFTSAVVSAWREQIAADWTKKYGNSCIGFETLVELPRRGDLYRRDGWVETGTTVGYTCKRIGGTGTDSWTGKRVWNTKELHPKIVLCRLK